MNNLPAPAPAAQLERAALSGYVRAISAEDMGAAISEYQRIQTVLDKALPNQIMTIQGRSFRMKAYWRAVGTAFNLAIDLVSTEILRNPEGEVSDVIIIVRATAPNGRSAIGDGTCSASEKKGAARTLHNIHAHALTRATNRAISNLVGFGEVSAEEVDRDGNSPDEVRVPTVSDVRQAVGGAAQRGWTPAKIRSVLDACDGVFETDARGKARLTGMPEATRAGCIALLTRDPPKGSDPAPAPSEPASPAAAAAEAAANAAAATGGDPWDRPTTEETEPEHDPSWSAVSAKFCASLKSAGLPDYKIVAAWCEETGRKRPSRMTGPERSELWSLITGPKKADLMAFAAAT